MKVLKKVILTFLVSLMITGAFCAPVMAAPRLSTAKIVLIKGQTKALKVKGTKEKVIWSSSKKNIATVNGKGLVRAKKAGKTVITAEIGKKKLTCSVKVENTAISNIEMQLKVGEIVPLSMINCTQKVGWKVSNKVVAIKKINAQEIYVLAKRQGTAMVTATVGGKKFTCKIIVTKSNAGNNDNNNDNNVPDDNRDKDDDPIDDTEEVTVESIRLNKDSVKITVGSTCTLEATVFPLNAADKTVTWSSDEPEIATVDDNGKVVGVSDGLTWIIARAGDCEASCEVWVDEVDVSSVRLNATSKSIMVGDSFVLEATVFPDNATDKTVTWSSDAPEIATVDSNGRVVGVSSGTAEITARSGRRDATCQVRVNEPDYTCGEEWKVDGEWGFKVNSVSTHDLCNSVSDKTGAQVVIIDYTYYQYGYYGSIMDLYFSSVDMDVTDEKGVAASTYPCTHTKYPKELHNIGESCNASEAFILENKSETISLTVSQYPSNGGQEKRARFVLPVKGQDVVDGKQMLKSYILSHGSTNVKGNRFIKSTYQSGTYGIAYDPSSEVFQFVQSSETGETSASIEVDVPEKSMGLLPAIYVWIYDPGTSKDAFSAEATINPRTYTADTDVVFNIKNSTFTDAGTLADGRKLANTALKLAFTGWSKLLLEGKVGITMKDIGFTAYE